MTSRKSKKNDFTSKVKVVVRIRPILAAEKARNDAMCLSLVSAGREKTQVTLTHATNNESYTYDFDKCYGENVTQRSLFQREVAAFIESVFRGVNSTIFAYGATGTGKTFTMEGSKRNPGIVSRAVKHLFDRGQSEVCSLRIHFSFIEIYNEKVFDLLSAASGAKSSKSRAEIPIRQAASGEIVLPTVQQKLLKDYQDFENLYELGCSHRRKGATALNQGSSRSHSILMLRVESKDKLGTFHTGKLHLIDLAGSEDNRRTGNVGSRLTESGKINMSLFVLGKVITALNESTNSALHRIPYRDSKLTRLLQDSLGGSSQAIMICNIAPTQGMFQESYQTLNYAAKARKIENTVVVSSRPAVDKTSAKSVRKGKENEEPASSRTKPSVGSSSIAEKLTKWKASKRKTMTITKPSAKGRDSLVSKRSRPSGASGSSNRSSISPVIVASTMRSNDRKLTSRGSGAGTTGSSSTNSSEKGSAGCSNTRTSFSSPLQVDRETEKRLKDLEDTLKIKAKSGEENVEVRLKTGKELVQVAVELEKNRNIKAALKVFYRAMKLLPPSEKLQQRVLKLESVLRSPREDKKKKPRVSPTTSHGSHSPHLIQLDSETKKRLEKDLLSKLNDGSKQELLRLHSIGEKRAFLIMELRSHERIQQLDDLRKIGLSEKQISVLTTLNTVAMK